LEDALLVSRLQFAFTVTYHYLFPMLTMGLALLIFVLKSVYMRNRNELYNNSARFWGKIFAVTFVMGVVTGIPLEFQFGTNWAAFSEYAGDIIAQTLAMEGAFAFFLESAFVGLFLWGEDRFGQRVHWFSSLMVFLGTWALDESGNFFQPLWTDFSPFSGTPGILDWYTVLIGLLALTTLVVHGSNFIALKTEDDLNARSRRIARGFSFATVLLTVVATLATFWVSPEMLRSFNERPYGYILPLVALAGLIGMVFFDLRGRDREAFLSSGAYIVGMLTSTVFGVYPNVLPAVDPANSLTIQNASASTYGMTVGLVWWSIGMVLAAVYFIIYRLFRGKVRL
jgi:Cytochrome bd terminal oxidase subunit I/Cytochrome bd terminal oxidase subunit II